MATGAGSDGGFARGYPDRVQGHAPDVNAGFARGRVSGQARRSRSHRGAHGGRGGASGGFGRHRRKAGGSKSKGLSGQGIPIESSVLGHANMMHASMRRGGYPYSGHSATAHTHGVHVGPVSPTMTTYGIHTAFHPQLAGPMNPRGAMANISPANLMAYQTQLQLAVPDHMVGAILGRHGSSINQLQRLTGTVIKVSQKGDFIMNSNNRTVSIHGPIHACQYASLMITQKISEAYPEWAKAPHLHS